MKAVIFTDLDGTLLDHNTYDAGAAAAEMRAAQETGVPICICSSKTRSEIMHYRSMLGITDPFISENGGAVFIPKGYFAAEPGARCPRAIEETFDVVELGTPYQILVTALSQVRDHLQIRIRAFHELTAEELAKECGLPREIAQLALEREYDEPFWIQGPSADIESVTAALRERSLNVTRGSRFHHVMGDNDKGKAVDLLMNRFTHSFPDAIFLGLGDSPNDIPMLMRVHIPILVKGPSGRYDEETQRETPGVRLADGIGPLGWSAAVAAWLSELKKV